MGHYAATCRQNRETNIDYMNDQNSDTDEIPNYMDDEDPEMNEIPKPTI